MTNRCSGSPGLQTLCRPDHHFPYRAHGFTCRYHFSAPRIRSHARVLNPAGFILEATARTFARDVYRRTISMFRANKVRSEVQKYPRVALAYGDNRKALSIPYRAWARIIAKYLFIKLYFSR